MASMTFDLVQQLVDRLTATEQAQLLAYLAPKLAGALVKNEAPVSSQPTTWEEFFAAGDALQNDRQASGQSMTEAILSMRR